MRCTRASSDWRFINFGLEIRVYSNNDRRTRRYERFSTVKAERFDDGVNLRTVQNFFFEQLLRDFMEQTEIRR